MPAWPAFKNYQFEDAVHEGLLFNPRASQADIVEHGAQDLADEYRVPLDADGIDVSTVHTDVQVNMTYTTNVMLIPGVYTTDWTFSPTASTRVLAGVRPLGERTHALPRQWARASPIAPRARFRTVVLKACILQSVQIGPHVGRGAGRGRFRAEPNRHADVACR